MTMTHQKHSMPLPKIDALMKPFWESACNHQLVIQKCIQCNHVHFPPSPVCPDCLGEDQEWVVVSGKGKLYSWCEFHRAYWDSVKDSMPYNVSMVELDEGPILITNLIDIEGIELSINMPLKVIFKTIDAGNVLPVFTPV
jgi:uncharacterized OB-fold protein